MTPTRDDPAENFYTSGRGLVHGDVRVHVVGYPGTGYRGLERFHGQRRVVGQVREGEV